MSFCLLAVFCPPMYSRVNNDVMTVEDEICLEGSLDKVELTCDGGDAGPELPQQRHGDVLRPEQPHDGYPALHCLTYLISWI